MRLINSLVNLLTIPLSSIFCSGECFKKPCRINRSRTATSLIRLIDIRSGSFAVEDIELSARRINELSIVGRPSMESTTGIIDVQLAMLYDVQEQFVCIKAEKGENLARLRKNHPSSKLAAKTLVAVF